MQTYDLHRQTTLHAHKSIVFINTRQEKSSLSYSYKWLITGVNRLSTSLVSHHHQWCFKDKSFNSILTSALIDWVWSHLSKSRMRSTPARVRLSPIENVKSTLTLLNFYVIIYYLGNVMYSIKTQILSNFF